MPKHLKSLLKLFLSLLKKFFIVLVLHLKPFLVLKSFRILFNLQGTSALCGAFFRAALSRALCYITTFARTCQELFSLVAAFFQPVFGSSRSLASALLYYHLFPPLSTPFFIFLPLFLMFFKTSKNTSVPIATPRFIHG